MTEISKLRVLDLFCGCGGFSLGFECAGFDVVGGVEIDKWAAATYSTNFPHAKTITRNIEGITNDEVLELFGNVDVIIGGPPCQGFSHSNIVNQDPKDPRNSLFQQWIRFVSILRPKICLMENVPGLLNSVTESGLKVIKLIEKSLEDIGYLSNYSCLNAVDFGVPQYRERLFIVGALPNLHSSWRWPTPTHSMDASMISLFGPTMKKWISLWEAISDLPAVETGKIISEKYSTPPENEFQSEMRAQADDKILNHEPMRHTERIVERFKEIKLGMSEEHVSDLNRPRKRGNPLEMSSKKYSQNSRRQHPDKPCNTVVASSHTNFIHPFLHRNFTIRELARIQSFPDRFVFKGKRAVLSKKLNIKKGLLDDIFLDQRMQLGNAVPPTLARILANEVIRVLGLSTMEP